MRTTKYILSVALAMFSLAFMPALASAGNDLSCTANVVYEGQTVSVKENVRSEDHAKWKLVEEGCDKHCEAIPTKPERKACEHACEAAAQLKDLQCGKKPEKSKDEEKLEDAQKMKCTGDVSYNGKTYSVKKKAKTEKKAKKKLKEKACLEPCTGFFGRVDESCMMKCEKDASVQNLKCEPPK